MANIFSTRIILEAGARNLQTIEILTSRTRRKVTTRVPKGLIIAKGNGTRNDL